MYFIKFRRAFTPFEVPAQTALIVGLIGMTLILVADIKTGEEIRLHVLYVFPLSFTVLHATHSWQTAISIIVAFAFQLATLLSYQTRAASFVADIVVALSALILTLLLSQFSKQNYQAAMHQATTDPLTGLSNRRAFNNILNTEIERHRRYRETFSLAMIDLDGFKALNDLTGHQAGDEALRLVADALRTHTRKSDFVARMGGDEFAILMPNTAESAGVVLCNQLCTTVATRMEAQNFRVTTSIGVAIFRTTPVSVEHAVGTADKAMYEAKKQGKNRVVTVLSN